MAGIQEKGMEERVLGQLFQADSSSSRLLDSLSVVGPIWVAERWVTAQHSLQVIYIVAKPKCPLHSILGDLKKHCSCSEGFKAKV